MADPEVDSAADEARAREGTGHRFLDRLEQWKFLVSLIVAGCGIAGLLIPVWMAKQNAQDSVEASSVARRAGPYQEFLGSVAMFDVSAARYICLAEGRQAPPGTLAAAFADLENSYTKLAQAAWGVDLVSSSGAVKEVKQKISSKADSTYDSLSLGGKPTITPEDLDRALVQLQGEFSGAAYEELTPTSPSPTMASAAFKPIACAAQ